MTVYAHSVLAPASIFSGPAVRLRNAPKERLNEKDAENGAPKRHMLRDQKNC